MAVNLRGMIAEQNDDIKRFRRENRRPYIKVRRDTSVVTRIVQNVPQSGNNFNQGFN